MRYLANRLSALAFAVGALMLAGGVASRYVTPTTQGSAPNRLVVTPAVHELTGLAVKESRHLTFELTNRDAGSPASLLGAESFCDQDVCIAVSPLRAVIPPLGTVRLDVEFESLKAGHVTRVFRVYTDSPNQAVIPIVIEATVRDDHVPRIAIVP